MKKLFKSFVYSLIIFSSISAFTQKAFAIKLTTAVTTKDGNISLQATQKNGNVTTAGGDIAAGTSADEKATLIVEAFRARGLIRIQQMGSMLIFPASVMSVTIIDDRTGEDETIAEALNNQKAAEGKIDGHLIESASSLSGIDGNGNESEFLASLGFKTMSENIVASSNFLFSELGGNDIDNWLSTIFTDLQGQLPAIYQSNLSLDLINDEILFVFPEDALPGSGLIANGATDINVSTSLSFRIESASVPEPTSTLSLLALGTLGASSLLKRNKKQKSTEKEPTKVG